MIAIGGMGWFRLCSHCAKIAQNVLPIKWQDFVLFPKGRTYPIFHCKKRGLAMETVKIAKVLGVKTRSQLPVSPGGLLSLIF
jgi:hypothetical protein